MRIIVLLTALAFGLWPLVFVAFVPMVVAQHRVLPRRWSSLAIGIGIGGAFAVHLSPGLADGDVAIVYQLMPLYLAAIAAGIAWRSRTFQERTGHRWLAVSFPVAFTAIEFLRSSGTETFGGTSPVNHSAGVRAAAAGGGVSEADADRSAASASEENSTWARRLGTTAIVTAPPMINSTANTRKEADVMRPTDPAFPARASVNTSCATTRGTTTIRRALSQTVPMGFRSVAASRAYAVPDSWPQVPREKPSANAAIDPNVTHLRLNCAVRAIISPPLIQEDRIAAKCRPAFSQGIT